MLRSKRIRENSRFGKLNIPTVMREFTNVNDTVLKDLKF